MEDKRITKTKKAIYQALVELYVENDFEDISISQLTGKANISRKTFYLHYSSIDNVIDEIINDIYTKLKVEFSDYYSTVNFHNFILFINACICSMYLNHKELIKSIMKKDKKLIISKKIIDILHLEIEKIIKNEFEIDENIVTYFCNMMASALINNFSIFVSREIDLSFEEIETIINDCLFYGLSNLKGK
ncbi:MAG: TetR/AcrR family transcriptional regulator [Bacilli bacterium]